jgi:hypothetical protein
MAEGRQFGRSGLLFAAVGLLTLSAGGPVWLASLGYAANPTSDDGFEARDLASLADLSLSTAPDQLLPLTEDEVLAANSSLPFSSDPVEAALPFKHFLLALDTAAENRAVECLTEAIFYEAAVEGDVGQRAVAQVILNRVRHPAFPSSVCGVVYQGSQLRTGCQFSFTCDGSLLRKPSSAGLSRARRVAVQALQGGVEATVGMATHYHANYVFPYWAPKLSKVAAVDTHIFYRWSGSWGRRRAFSQAYSGEAALFTAHGTSQLIEEGEDDAPDSGPLPHADTRQNLVSDRMGTLVEVSRRSKLRADEDTGALKMDVSPPQLVIDAKTSAPAAAKD